MKIKSLIFLSQIFFYRNHDFMIIIIKCTTTTITNYVGYKFITSLLQTQRRCQQMETNYLYFLCNPIRSKNKMWVVYMVRTSSIKWNQKTKHA